MITYAERACFRPAHLRLLAHVEALVARVSKTWGNELRCHELARAVHLVIGDHGQCIVDGKCGPIEHSWLYLSDGVAFTATGLSTDITSSPSDGGHTSLDVVTNIPGVGGYLRGKTTTTSIAEVPVRNTAYTEQAANAQRSLSSTSAADTAAGTGARSVRVTYYSLTAGVVAGPFTETVILNGVTGVNTVATNICYVESIEVLTAGSGGVNAGIIQLWTGLAATGAVFASIAAGDRTTFYGHHYVATGKTCFMTDVGISSTAVSTTVSTFSARFIDLTVANSAERILMDALDAQGTTSRVGVQFSTPRKVAGPARITFYVTPPTATSQVSKLSGSFYDV